MDSGSNGRAAPTGVGSGRSLDRVSASVSRSNCELMWLRLSTGRVVTG